jgi:hypothetical protein
MQNFLHFYQNFSLRQLAVLNSNEKNGISLRLHLLICGLSSNEDNKKKKRFAPEPSGRLSYCLVQEGKQRDLFRLAR